MPKIDQYSDPVCPASPETPAVELLTRFEAGPDLQLIPVIEGDRVVGLIERSALLMRLTVSPAAPYTASQLMDAEPVVVDGSIDARHLCDILLKGGPSALTRGFIVTQAGRYHGVGTATCLLQALARIPPVDARDPVSTTDAATSERLFGLIDAEMSAPIHSIRAMTDLLRRKPAGVDHLQDVLVIEEQADRLLTVLEDAAELTRAAPKGLVTATALRGIMCEVEATWAPRAALNGVTLMVGYEGDTDLVADVDGVRLRRLFDNLVGNALKLARDGMVEARLKVQVVDAEVQMIGQVRDDASRSQVADLLAILKSDVTSDDGFALNVGQALTTRLGGRLWSENNAGRGITVNFELTAPRSQVIEAPVSTGPSLVDVDTSIAPHILIVDDNATNRVVAQALCEMFGCSCEVAEDGLEALEAVQARSFDLVLMDIKMPRLDGVQATLAIRALDGPQSGVPIIALTANADPADAANYIASGMASVVEKPIKPERLRLAMNTALTAAKAVNSPAVESPPTRSRKSSPHKDVVVEPDTSRRRRA